MKALLPKPKRVTPRKTDAAYAKSDKRMSRAAEAGVSEKTESAAVKPQAPKKGPLPPKFQPKKTAALHKVELGPKQTKEKPPSLKKPERPSEPALSFADKIRKLQEKFGGIR